MLKPIALGFRIIPAGAGKSHGWSPFGHAVRDHPRGCGEKKC